MTKVRGVVGVFSLLCAVGLLGLPINGRAEGSRTFGTASLVSYTIHASAFTRDPDVVNTSGTEDIETSGDRFCEGTPVCRFVAPVFLPAGARVAIIELEACDTSSTTRFQATLNRARTTSFGESTAQVASILTDPEDTPGCTRIRTNVSGGGGIIDNDANAYFVTIFMDDPQRQVNLSSATSFMALRLYYTLQVSPAPAVATFGDVPVGHPQHQFIEALVASGITAGCGDGNYCPDAPLTRGQMAVFLSKGLGLHFAP